MDPSTEEHALTLAGQLAEQPATANAGGLLSQLRSAVTGAGGNLKNLIVYMATHPAAVAKLFADAASGNYAAAIADFIADWRAANPSSAPPVATTS